MTSKSTESAIKEYIAGRINNGIPSSIVWANPELKAKLITAMESGEYKPATGMMRRKLHDGSYCYCSLGVLADILVNEGKCKWIEESYVDLVEGGPPSGLLSVAAPEYYVLDTINMPHELAVAIFKLNDGWGRRREARIESGHFVDPDTYDAVIYYLKNHVTDE